MGDVVDFPFPRQFAVPVCEKPAPVVLVTRQQTPQDAVPVVSGVCLDHLAVNVAALLLLGDEVLVKKVDTMVLAQWRRLEPRATAVPCLWQRG